MESENPPELGGESRVITVYFSDVAGFSSFSEKMTPAQFWTLDAGISAMGAVLVLLFGRRLNRALEPS